MIWVVVLNLGYVPIYIFPRVQFLETPFLGALRNLLPTVVCSKVSITSSNKSLYQMLFLLHSVRYIFEHCTNSELFILFTPISLQGCRPPLSWQKSPMSPWCADQSAIAEPRCYHWCCTSCNGDLSPSHGDNSTGVFFQQASKLWSRSVRTWEVGFALQETAMCHLNEKHCSVKTYSSCPSLLLVQTSVLYSVMT